MTKRSLLVQRVRLWVIAGSLACSAIVASGCGSGDRVVPFTIVNDGSAAVDVAIGSTDSCSSTEPSPARVPSGHGDVELVEVGFSQTFLITNGSGQARCRAVRFAGQWRDIVVRASRSTCVVTRRPFRFLRCRTGILTTTSSDPL